MKEVGGEKVRSDWQGAMWVIVGLLSEPEVAKLVSLGSSRFIRLAGFVF